MASPVGMINLGASCYINAGLQAMFAVPEICRVVRDAVDDELACRLARVLEACVPEDGPMVPRPITDVFYNGRQEDAMGFVEQLLWSCGELSACVRGAEHPRLRCRHCGWERPTARSNFQCLQLAMPSAEYMPGTTQDLLDLHLNQPTALDVRVEDWCCLREACLDAGRHDDPPLHVNYVEAWPRVLLLQLKRWDEFGRARRDLVRCSHRLEAGDRVYELVAAVSHIGEHAESGHYIAYVRGGDRWYVANDSSVDEITPCDMFRTYPDEKSYMAFYVAMVAVPPEEPPVTVCSQSDEGEDTD